MKLFRRMDFITSEKSIMESSMLSRSSFNEHCCNHQKTLVSIAKATLAKKLVSLSCLPSNASLCEEKNS